MQRTILMIDDEPDILDLVGTALEVAGFRALGAESAQEGLRLLERERVDLILLDLSMPDLDGFEFCWRLARAQPGHKIPIVVLSALETGPSGEEFLSTVYQVRARLGKPFAPQDLVDCVRNLLIMDHTETAAATAALEER